MLSAGKVREAQRAFENSARKSIQLPNADLVQGLVKLYRSRDLHPFEYLAAIDEWSAAMGWPALKILVEYAWNNRNQITKRDQQSVRKELDALGDGTDALVSIYSQIGMIATATGNRDLALQIWRHCAELPGGSVYTPNIAADLSQLGRHAEALDAAERMDMETPRSWTILGNVRLHAGQSDLSEFLVYSHGKKSTVSSFQT